MGAHEVAGGQRGPDGGVGGAGTALRDHRLGEQRVLALHADEFAHDLGRGLCRGAGEVLRGQSCSQDGGAVHQSLNPAENTARPKPSTATASRTPRTGTRTLSATAQAASAASPALIARPGYGSRSPNRLITLPTAAARPPRIARMPRMRLATRPRGADVTARLPADGLVARSAMPRRTNHAAAPRTEGSRQLRIVEPDPPPRAVAV